MGERIRKAEMASTSTAIATTVPPQVQEEAAEPVAVITLRPAPRKQERKKVVWAENTVDNENMNKKKSKCCCIYEKPHKFGESDSEDSSDECEHCFGHVERKGNKHHHHHDHQRATTSADATDGSTVLPAQTVTTVAEPPATVTLRPAEGGRPTEGGRPGPPDKGGDRPPGVSS